MLIIYCTYSTPNNIRKTMNNNNNNNNNKREEGF